MHKRVPPVLQGVRMSIYIVACPEGFLTTNGFTNFASCAQPLNSADARMLARCVRGGFVMKDAPFFQHENLFQSADFHFISERR
jgi:hypothetical protein